MGLCYILGVTKGLLGHLHLEHFSTHLYFMICIEGFIFELSMYLTMSCEYFIRLEAMVLFPRP